MREQKISSSYLTITSIVKLLSHLVLILPMMCGRLIIPQLLCLSSTERCCIRTIQWSSLPKKSLLSKACSEAAQEMSLWGWCSTASLVPALPLPPQQSPHAIQHRRADRFLKFLQEVHSLSWMHSSHTLGRWMGWETGCAQGCSSGSLEMLLWSYIMEEQGSVVIHSRQCSCTCKNNFKNSYKFI